MHRMRLIFAWCLAGTVILASDAFAQEPPAAQAEPRCKQPDPVAVEESDPFTTRDNIVTGIGAGSDAAAGLVMHTIPIFVLFPLLAVTVDAAIAGRRSVPLPIDRPLRVDVGNRRLLTIQPELPTMRALGVIGALAASYAITAPLIDAAIVLAVRTVDRQRWLGVAHLLGTVVASYLSFPVAFVAAMGAVGFVGVLAEPELPSQIPSRRDLDARGVPATVPGREELQSAFQLLAFALTMELVLVGIRPVALALIERAGNALLDTAEEKSARPSER